MARNVENFTLLQFNLIKVVLGCSQRGGGAGCAEVCQWTGPPPVSCPVLATLDAAGPANPEQASNCSDGLAAAYSTCNSTEDLNWETRDGQVRRKKRSRSYSSQKIFQHQNYQEENCCCLLTISTAGLFSSSTRSQVLELGMRDLELLHHDPHCIFIASSLMKMQRMEMQRMRIQGMRMQRMRMQRMRMRIPPDAHHPRCIITGESPSVHEYFI